jgi:hypothetical protein
MTEALFGGDGLMPSPIHGVMFDGGRSCRSQPDLPRPGKKPPAIPYSAVHNVIFGSNL